MTSEIPECSGEAHSRGGPGACGTGWRGRGGGRGGAEQWEEAGCLGGSEPRAEAVAAQRPRAGARRAQCRDHGPHPPCAGRTTPCQGLLCGPSPQGACSFPRQTPPSPPRPVHRHQHQLRVRAGRSRRSRPAPGPTEAALASVNSWQRFRKPEGIHTLAGNEATQTN